MLAGGGEGDMGGSRTRYPSPLSAYGIGLYCYLHAIGLAATKTNLSGTGVVYGATHALCGARY
eukprot:1704371-Rhodomonas_salina.1